MHAFSLEIEKKCVQDCLLGTIWPTGMKNVIRHQNMRSQGLTGLSGPIATSEIVLSYALSTLTKRTDFNFSRFLIFLIDILFTFFKSELRFLRCHSEFFDQTTQSCDELGVVGWLDGQINSGILDRSK